MIITQWQVIHLCLSSAGPQSPSKVHLGLPQKIPYVSSLMTHSGSSHQVALIDSWYSRTHTRASSQPCFHCCHLHENVAVPSTDPWLLPEWWALDIDKYCCIPAVSSAELSPMRNREIEKLSFSQNWSTQIQGFMQRLFVANKPESFVKTPWAYVWGSPSSGDRQESLEMVRPLFFKDNTGMTPRP